MCWWPWLSTYQSIIIHALGITTCNRWLLEALHNVCSYLELSITCNETVLDTACKNKSFEGCFGKSIAPFIIGHYDRLYDQKYIYIRLPHQLSNMNTCTQTEFKMESMMLGFLLLLLYGSCLTIGGQTCELMCKFGRVCITLPWSTTISTECIVYFCWCGSVHWRSLYIPTVYISLN